MRLIGAVRAQEVDQPVGANGLGLDGSFVETPYTFLDLGLRGEPLEALGGQLVRPLVTVAPVKSGDR